MTRSIRILALVTEAFAGYGGISQYNRDLLTGLSGADPVEEIVVLPRLGDADKEALPNRVRQLSPVFSRIGYSLSAVGIAATRGPFHLVFCGHLFHCQLAAIIARGLGVPLWLQLHGTDAWTRPHFATRWAVEQSDLVTVVSRYTKRRFLAWANLYPDLVRVLPNTVGERYAPGPKSAHFVTKYGLQGKRILLTVSRISVDDWYKGHYRVIQVLPDLLGEFPDLVYVVAGDGNGRERLQQMACTSGVAERVRFIGRVSDEQLPDLYRTADAFVMPSTKEGFGIVFLEAIRSGIPAIGGNGDGSVDPLRDGAAGYAISCESPAELINAIRSALSKPRGSSDHAKVFNSGKFSRHCKRLLIHLRYRREPNKTVRCR